MRIALTTTSTSLGGAWRNVVHLAEAMTKRGHDVLVGLSVDAHGPRSEADERGLTVCTPRQSTDARIDIFHIHLHDTYDPHAAGLLALRRSRGASVATEHLPHFNGSDRNLLPQGSRSVLTAPVKTVLKRVSIATCDAVIVPSERVTEFFRARYRLGPSTRLYAIPLGLPAQRDTREIPEEPIGRVLATGSMIVQKGFDLLAEAVRISSSDWPLTILGDGPHRQRLEQELGALLGSRVVVSGWQAEPLNWLDQARTVCLPSRWETFPFAAIEAQLAARPVVAFAVDGIPEIIEHDVTGILVEPGDVRELSRSLDRLAQDRALSCRLGAAGRNRALRLFRLKDMADRTETVYRAVLRQR